MTKGLSSYPEEQRQSIATRRLNNSTRGNGFWGAKSYFDKKGMRYPGKMGAMQSIQEALDHSKHDGKAFTQPDDAPNTLHPRGKKKGGPGKQFKQKRNFKPHLNRMRVAK